jgi:hypothetical protein
MHGSVARLGLSTEAQPSQPLPVAQRAMRYCGASISVKKSWKRPISAACHVRGNARLAQSAFAKFNSKQCWSGNGRCGVVACVGRHVKIDVADKSR